MLQVHEHGPTRAGLLAHEAVTLGQLRVEACEILGEAVAPGERHPGLRHALGAGPVDFAQECVCLRHVHVRNFRFMLRLEVHGPDGGHQHRGGQDSEN